MPGTRYKLIGECVVFIVKSPDIILRRVLSELKQVKKIKRKSFSKKKKISEKSKRKKIVGKIYYTKNDQPYKIMSDGKARFLKK